MRFLLFVCFVFLVGFIQAQQSRPTTFVGQATLFSNGADALGVFVVDSPVFLIDISGLNYYGIKNLNAHQLNVAKLNTTIGVKASYLYFQENVFVNHLIKLGMQKRIGSKLYTNLMLGSNIKEIDSQSVLEFQYGMAWRYHMNTQVFIHHQFLNLGRVGRIGDLQSQTALQYKVSQAYAVLAQLDYNTVFDGRLSLVFNAFKLKIQLSHQFVQNTLEFGLGFRFRFINCNINYSYHNVLGQLVYVKLQIAL